MQYSQSSLMCGAFLSMAFAQPAGAQSYHPLLELDQDIAQYLGAAVGEIGGARDIVDRRLKLSKCAQKPALEPRGSTHLIVQCRSKGWRITVPLKSASSSTSTRRSAQRIVQRGQPVLLAVRRNGFVISRQMIADRAGGLGDIIAVRSSRRSSPIMAEITGPGRVSLPIF